MTDEELQQTIQDVCENIDKLSDPDKPLTKEEKQHRQRLLFRKEVLYKIEEAKAKQDKDEELHHAMTYGLLTSWGERHPYLMYLMSSKFGRWSFF